MDKAEFAFSPESRKIARQHQIMQVLCKYPRITVGEVARKTGLSKTYCFNLLQGMLYRGLVATVKGRARAGQDTRLYVTAYDHLIAGGEVPELDENEVVNMMEAWSRGQVAQEWYGYTHGNETVALQELLF